MITDLRLQHFRSYGDESFDLSPGVNIIVGPNASGKTNLLEALLVVCRGSSYRAKDQDLISFNNPWARLDAHTESGGSRTVKLSNDLPPKTYEIDGKESKRLSLNSSLPAVLFEPNHLLLLAGSPELRRNYIDDLLEQTSPGYGELRRRYKRTLAQRNSLLKKGYQAARGQVFVWDVRLSELGGKLATERLALIEIINGLITKTYRNLSRTKSQVVLSYSTSCQIGQYETSLLKHLDKNLENDCWRGFTSAGPHRDDIKVSLNGLSVENTASRGEARSIILALKIIELQLLEKSRAGQAPLLLLDDVFSELDGRRRHALTDYLAPYQTFITTTDADLVLQHFTESCNVIPLT